MRVDLTPDPSPIKLERGDKQMLNGFCRSGSQTRPPGFTPRYHMRAWMNSHTSPNTVSRSMSCVSMWPLCSNVCWIKSVLRT